ncbi:MAG TPA: hypothetical protein K8V06_00235 [Ligilactobacillus salivarius]|uniref:Uncharacterized protein n=2 Tax=Lactobacillaceae TaxID=33958 RepID=A0A921FJ03_9LACO|nr:hypothetical protein [Lactobacillus crispatus]HJG14558.1 hypothetical protein [Ligilactobacillus salivarius]
MSGRWHFDNAKYINKDRPLDTNPDHYKNMDSKTENDYVEGVAIYTMDGSVFKFKDLTVDDVFDAINVHKDRWINISNGGQVNLGYVICYQPWKFYKHDSYKRKY